MKPALQRSFQRAAGPLLAIGPLAFALAFGSGCSTPVTVSADAEADFSQYRTWSWPPKELPDAGSTEASASALDERLARHIYRALNARGLRYAREDPDLVVAARLLVTRKQMTIHTTPATHWLLSLHNSPSYEIQYTRSDTEIHEVGHLVIVVSDRRRNRVVWRGEIEKTFPSAFEPHVDEVVASLFGHFPTLPGRSPGYGTRAIARNEETRAAD